MNGDHCLQAYVIFQTAGVGYPAVSVPDLELGKIYLIGISFDGSLLKFYFEGDKVAELDFSGDSLVSRSEIGTWYYSRQGPKLDELLVFTRALSDDEIKRIWKHRNVPWGLEARIRYNEGIGYPVDEVKGRILSNIDIGFRWSVIPTLR